MILANTVSGSNGPARRTGVVVETWADGVAGTVGVAVVGVIDTVDVPLVPGGREVAGGTEVGPGWAAPDAHAASAQVNAAPANARLHAVLGVIQSR